MTLSSYFVITGAAAIRVGQYWRGVAAGNVHARQLRRTREEAIRDAKKLEPKEPK